MNTLAVSSRRFVGETGRYVHKQPVRIAAPHLQNRLGSASPFTLAPTTKDSSVSCRLICPICLQTEFSVDIGDSNPSLSCGRCRRTFDSSKFVDMTLSSGLKNTEYMLRTEPMTSTFQSPLVSFVYERGWRQGFSGAGFPGPDAEFEAAMDYFAPVTGGTVLDLSCGSGLFTRRFLNSDAFDSVVAVDFSEAMLTQTAQYVNRMDPKPKNPLQLVRADVSRLPFQTGAFKAIYAGAAIHCWPNSALALAEISRILSPGGVFVFTTFTVYPKEVEEFFMDNPAGRFIKPLVPRYDPAQVSSSLYAV